MVSRWVATEPLDLMVSASVWLALGIKICTRQKKNNNQCVNLSFFAIIDIFQKSSRIKVGVLQKVKKVEGYSEGVEKWQKKKLKTCP